MSFVRYEDIMLGEIVDVRGRGSSAVVCYCICPPWRWKVERLKLGGDVAVTRELFTNWKLHERFLDT